MTKEKNANQMDIMPGHLVRHVYGAVGRVQTIDGLIYVRMLTADGFTLNVIPWRREEIKEILPVTEHFDFVSHLYRQRHFSRKTFGPGARVAGVTDHIAKELAEVRTSGGALYEWVDVIILGLDGALRSGASPEEIIVAIVEKQARNEARQWPDWRTADPDKAIEHVRTGEAAE